MFIAFTGEESGLIGSARYTREPRFPLEKTIAMLNMDMVGRLTDDKLIVYGTGTAKEFDPLVERLCKEHGFKLTQAAGRLRAQRSFVVLRQEDSRAALLHRHAQRLSPAQRRRSTSSTSPACGAWPICWSISCGRPTLPTRGRPTLKSAASKAWLDRPKGDRPSFGSMPAYPNPVKDGVLLEAVLEGTPADKAGIKGGDVLVKFGDNKITVLEDFEAALRHHKPGDTVKVTVRRGQELIESDVTLARRRAMP